MQQKNEAGVTIDPAKTALLLLHWQNDIAAPGGKRAREIVEKLAATNTIEHTQAVLKASREKGVLVVYVVASHRPGYPEIPAKRVPLFSHVVASGTHIRGTWDTQVIDQLKPLDDEIVVYNYFPSSFYSTDLDLILRDKGITDLVLSGVATNWAVESTARDGICHGYFIYTLKDCCLSHTDEMHNWSLTNILSVLGVVLDSETYIAALKGHMP
jgi:nicotinamidase-related amidase